MASPIGGSTKKEMNKYECSVCGLLSTRKSGVIAHVDKYHPEEKDTCRSDNMVSKPWPIRQRFSGKNPAQRAAYKTAVQPINMAKAQKAAMTRASRKAEMASEADPAIPTAINAAKVTNVAAGTSNNGMANVQPPQLQIQSQPHQILQSTLPGILANPPKLMTLPLEVRQMIYSVLVVVDRSPCRNPGQIKVGEKLQLLQISRQFKDELLQTISQRNIIIKLEIREAAGFVNEDLHNQLAAYQQPWVDARLACHLGESPIKMTLDFRPERDLTPAPTTKTSVMFAYNEQCFAFLCCGLWSVAGSITKLTMEALPHVMLETKNELMPQILGSLSLIKGCQSVSICVHSPLSTIRGLADFMVTPVAGPRQVLQLIQERLHKGIVAHNAGRYRSALFLFQLGLRCGAEVSHIFASQPDGPYANLFHIKICQLARKSCEVLLDSLPAVEKVRPDHCNDINTALVLGNQSFDFPGIPDHHRALSHKYRGLVLLLLAQVRDTPSSGMTGPAFGPTSAYANYEAAAYDFVCARELLPEDESVADGLDFCNVKLARPTTTAAMAPMVEWPTPVFIRLDKRLALRYGLAELDKLDIRRMLP